MRPRDAWCWVLLLLLALFSDAASGRRGAGGRAGGRGGGGGGGGGLRGGFRAVSHGGGTPSRGSKVAGAIVAGAAAGYGMGLLGRPRPSRLGHGPPAARQPPLVGGFHAPVWPEVGAKRGPPSRAPGEQRSGIVPTLLLANAICFVCHRMQF